MNIPTHCTNCETTEGVKFVCRGCNFARFCSRECQKKCWKKHKRHCLPLNDAVSALIEKARPLLKNYYRIDNQELHCMFCLEGGTSEDPLFHSGCGCRPDSGMSIGHIKCFQEFARASFADEKKREDSFHCCVSTCSNCSQDRIGILKFEMLLILWKLYDRDCLTRKNVQGINNKRAIFMSKSLFVLDSALIQTNYLYSAHRDFILYCRLRILYLTKNVSKQIQCNECIRIHQEIKEDVDIGKILTQINKYQATIDFNRRNYEKYLLNITEYPELKCYSHGVLNNYARSLFEAFQASSQKSDVGNDPPYHYLEEAERLMEEAVRETSREDINLYVVRTHLLCRILLCQERFAEANKILTPCLQKAQRILGPSHIVTKDLLSLYDELYAKTCVHTNSISAEMSHVANTITNHRSRLISPVPCSRKKPLPEYNGIY